MENIQLDSFTFKQSWDEVTLREFLQIRDILESPNYDEFEKELMVLGVLGGLDDYKVLEHIDKRDAEALFNNSLFLMEPPKGDIQDLYEVGGIQYRFQKDIKTMKSGQFIMLEKFIRENEQVYNNMAKICSYFLLPTKVLSPLQRQSNKVLDKVSKSEIGSKMAANRGLKTFLPEFEDYNKIDFKSTEENLLENLSITQAMGMYVFFWAISNIYIEYSLPYLEQQATEKLKLALKNLRADCSNPASQIFADQVDPLLQSITDGLPLSTDLLREDVETGISS